MDFKDKKILIVGFSTTGVASAKYFTLHGADVYLTEIKEKKENTEDIERLGVKLEFGSHSDSFIQGAEFAILSPSVPLNSEIIRKLQKFNVPYMSDIEFAYKTVGDKLIPVTGTNGKTTTTMLVSNVLSAKFKAQTCGNIGVSPLELLESNLDFYVCEASSYQLEYSKTLTPKIAVFTNLTPDHLSFHGNVENYFEAKAKMFRRMTSDGYAILNYDDERLRALGKTLKAKVYYFSTVVKADLYLENDFIMFENEKIISVSDLQLCGLHNYKNVMAAIAVAKILGLTNDEIVSKLKAFKAPEHRCEFVCKRANISFYNDSKATNPEATIVALSAFNNSKVALILGGRDKNTSLDELCGEIKKYIKDVILIGEAKERFAQALEQSGFRNITFADTLQEATDKAILKNPDVVLLSPACASFDMFNSFEHRGEVFKEYVLSKK